MMRIFLATAVLLSFVFGLRSPAGGEDEARPGQDSIRRAVEKALPLLEASSRRSAEQRKCFTCHNEGLPILVFVEAGKRGFEIDRTLVIDLTAHTEAHLKRGKSNYLKGIGQGGKADTAGSALWALDAAGRPRSEATDAVIEFLIQRNADTPYWQAQSNRPPSEGSRFTSTFLALRGLAGYALDAKREAIEKRTDAARQWLIETEPESMEDRVFRLRALDLAGAPQSRREAAAAALLEKQRDDGGWRQLPGLESDAYATGSALAALHAAAMFPPDSPARRRGLKFLLDSQQADGSWHVVSRSRPIQEFYDTGFPHGEDQFISASATAWATLALLQALPIESAGASDPEKTP